MRILGIESSCDECSIAVVEDGHKILSLVVHSQIENHKQYGGIVPELASRLHIAQISTLYDNMCAELGYSSQKMGKFIDGIAVTVCPGLSGSLLVGLQFAKALSLVYNVPLIGIDHILAHFYSGRLVEPITYPYVGVVVSGGHTLFAVVHNYDVLDIKGRTIDDACGEAFEKVGRALGLSYPGGPAIDRIAREEGCSDAAKFPTYSYAQYGYNVSYSGLKTAVLHHRKKYWNEEFEESTANIAAAFEHAAIEMIVERVEALILETGIKRVSFGGGVVCNSYLKKRIGTLLEHGVCTQAVLPPPVICADNGAMIAGLGFQYLSRNIFSSLNLGVSARKNLYKAW